jgi:protein subunit release factor A
MLVLIYKIKKVAMEKIVLEIRDSEGGKDAKLLVDDMAEIYLRSAIKNNFNAEIVDSRDGFVALCL